MAFFISAFMNTHPTSNKKVQRAWVMYDWANSVYSLVITSTIFPVYYNAVTQGVDGSDKVSFFGWEMVNTVLYSYSISFSFLVIALAVLDTLRLDLYKAVSRQRMRNRFPALKSIVAF